VLIDLPSDVLAAVSSAPIPEQVARRGYKEAAVANGRQLKAAAELIGKAERPLLYVGGGIILSGAAQELRALAEKGQIPVTHTLMAIGAMDPASPLAIGMLGMYGAWHANKAVEQCDCLIAVGARFDDRVTGRLNGFAPNARIIHIDIDPSSIRKVTNTALPVVGDARETLAQLSDLVERRDRGQWLDRIGEWQRQVPLPRPQREQLVPHQIMETLAELAGPFAIVASDVGLSQMWTANYLPFAAPRRFITSGGLGTMGYALPAAVGAALGNPGTTVVAVTGDGAFQMNVQELATCAHYGIPVKTVVLNNGKLGMVRQFQNVFLDRRYSATDLGSHVDFCLVAQGFGVQAFKVTGKEELREQLAVALAVPGPAVVEVEIDPDCYSFPMVPPGKSSVEMIFSPEEWRGAGTT
jgi:acetolactate synthase-1/2/3 large subunit